MSTLAFAEFTNKRENAQPGTSSSSNPPGVSTFVDALAALVPAEVLTLHAVFLSVTTSTAEKVTTITDATTLKWAFAGLIVLSIVLYVVPKVQKLGHIRLRTCCHTSTCLCRMDHAATVDGVRRPGSVVERCSEDHHCTVSRGAFGVTRSTSTQS